MTETSIATAEYREGQWIVIHDGYANGYIACRIVKVHPQSVSTDAPTWHKDPRRVNHPRITARFEAQGPAQTLAQALNALTKAQRDETEAMAARHRQERETLLADHRALVGAAA